MLAVDSTTTIFRPFHQLTMVDVSQWCWITSIAFWLPFISHPTKETQGDDSIKCQPLLRRLLSIMLARSYAAEATHAPLHGTCCPPRRQQVLIVTINPLNVWVMDIKYLQYLVPTSAVLTQRVMLSVTVWADDHVILTASISSYHTSRREGIF